MSSCLHLITARSLLHFVDPMMVYCLGNFGVPPSCSLEHQPFLCLLIESLCSDDRTNSIMRWSTDTPTTRADTVLLLVSIKAMAGICDIIILAACIAITTITSTSRITGACVVISLACATLPTHIEAVDLRLATFQAQAREHYFLVFCRHGLLSPETADLPRCTVTSCDIVEIRRRGHRESSNQVGCKSWDGAD
jgi:hypothetical protein